MIKNIKCFLLTSVVLGFLQLETSAMEDERGDNKTTPIRQACSDITRWSEEIDNKINALTKENEILRRKVTDFEERLKPLKSILEHSNVDCRPLGFRKKKDLLNNDRTWLLQEIGSQSKLIGNTRGSQSWQAAGSKLEATEERCIKLTTNTSTTTHTQLTQDFLTEEERIVRIPFSINVTKGAIEIILLDRKKDGAPTVANKVFSVGQHNNLLEFKAPEPQMFTLLISNGLLGETSECTFKSLEILLGE